MTPDVIYCSICGAETELYVNGRPLCVACANPAKSNRDALDDVRAVEIHCQLQDAERSARAELDSALAMFDSLASQPRPLLVPSETLDCTRNALSRIGLARANYQAAHKRLLDFVLKGVVPDNPNPGD